MSQDDPASGVGELLFRAACDPAQSQELYATLTEFFHTMRNRLNSLKLGLYVGRKLEEDEGRTVDPQWAEIERQYQLLEQYFDQVHSFIQPSRLEPMPLNLSLFLREKARKWQGRFGSTDPAFSLVVPESPTPAVFDPGQMGQALDQFAHWRFAAGGTPRLLLGVTEGDVTLIWDEIGPPRTEADVPSRGSIALATLAKVVTGHDGEIGVNRDNGYRVRMTWPLEPSFRNTNAPVRATARAGSSPVGAGVAVSGQNRGGSAWKSSNRG